MHQAKRLSGVHLLVLLTIATFGQISEAYAATSIALVGSVGNDGVANVLDTATALLGKDADLQILDRAEVYRVLREQEFSLAGVVRAEDAIKAGQLLHVDLFVVIEGTLTNETDGFNSIGLVVFDAKSGVRYADSALLASNTISAASAVAVAVRAAVVKAHQGLQDLHTVGLLSVRNADLPRQFDSICDSVGLLLERELTASPGIAVLERRRLEQVNQERSVAPDAEGNRLLSSLRVMQLDISRDGEGLRGTLAFVGADGARNNEIAASVPTRDPAALAHLLADKTEQYLKVPSDSTPADREAEAARFHSEYLLLLQHRDYIAAVHPLDAALALAPEQMDWRREMAMLLLDAAIEYVDPGGQNWHRPLDTQPSSENLSTCLALGQRGADLLLDVSREVVAQARPGEPVPEVPKNFYTDPLKMLLEKLADVRTADPVSTAEIAALNGKERTLLKEVLEPFLIKQSVDSASFATYNHTLGYEFIVASMNQQDAELALSHWIEVSHKMNPPDGSGDYNPMSYFLFLSHYRGSQIAEFLKTLEQDQDPVIRIYAHAGRVTSTMNPTGYHSDETLAAEREFRLYAQDMSAHGEAAKPGPLHECLWGVIEQTLRLLLNHPDGGNEYLEACRFAFAQGDIQPNLFYRAAEWFEIPRNRNLSTEFEVVDGALKLILDKPDAYPTIKGSYSNRSEVIRDLQQKRDKLAAELAGTNAIANVPINLPWNQSVCLLDLAKPMNGYAWLFKPVVQEGQVYAVALGVQEWGLPEDSMQLMRVPLEGGPPTFLSRTKFFVFSPVNGRKDFLERRLSREKNAMTASFDFVRAACVGAGCYFAATGSGVFIFPTNDGPVLQLNTTNGLPSDDIHAVAFLDGKLYIGAGEFQRGGYIASYEPANRKVTVLASSRRSEHLSPLDDQQPFYTLGLAADTIRHRLIMAITTDTPPPHTNSPAITPDMGIWAYLPGTGEYKRLAPLRIPANDPQFWRDNMWFGLVDANTVAVKELFMMALFDFRSDRLIFAYNSQTARTNAAMRFWESPVPGVPGSTKLPGAPFFLRDGWFYSARPFERMAMADGRREELPPLRTDYPFQPRESLQLLDDGKHVLAADQISLWLLELKSESSSAPVDNENIRSALTEK